MLRPRALALVAALAAPSCSKVNPPARAPAPSGAKPSGAAEPGGGAAPGEGAEAPKGAEAEATPAPAPPPAAPRFPVSFEGKAVDLPNLYAKSLPLGGYAVYATSDGGSCEELLSSVYNRSDDEKSVLVRLGERLAPDGTVSLAVTDVVTMDGALDPGATVSVSGGAGVGETLTAALKASVSDNGKTLIAIDGKAAAKGCGAQPPDSGMGFPKAAHPSTATITLAGKTVPLVGARRRGTEILLSTSPLDCSPSQPAAYATLSHRAGTWELAGAWFAKTERAQDKGMEGDTMPEVRIEPGATGTSDDGPTVSLALSGTGAMGPYPVVLAGTIEALECEP